MRCSLAPIRGSVVLLVLCLVGIAPAQTPQQQGFRPLDQIIEDQDPLRHSLRRVQQGIGFTGQESYVYTRPGEGGRIYYIRPGIVASFDRSEYFQLQDGPLLQMIPPNTIFYLGSPPPVPDVEQGRPRSPLMQDRQVDRRIGAVPRTGAAFDLPPQDAMSRYFTWRRLHRQALVEAIDRTVAQEIADQDAAASPR